MGAGSAHPQRQLTATAAPQTLGLRFWKCEPGTQSFWGLGGADAPFKAPPPGLIRNTLQAPPQPVESELQVRARDLHCCHHQTLVTHSKGFRDCLFYFFAV